MAQWKNIDQKEMDAAFKAIQSLFLTGSIEKMYQLIDHKPTKIAKLLGMSYKGLHEKLREPSKFTQLHILTLSYAVNIDPNIINDVIQKESLKKVVEKIKKFKAKE